MSSAPTKAKAILRSIAGLTIIATCVVLLSELCLDSSQESLPRLLTDADSTPPHVHRASLETDPNSHHAGALFSRDTITFKVRDHVSSELLDTPIVIESGSETWSCESKKVTVAPEVVASGFSVRADGYAGLAIQPWGVREGSTVFLRPLINVTGRTIHQGEGLGGVTVMYCATPSEVPMTDSRVRRDIIQGRTISQRDGRFDLPNIPCGYRVSITAKKTAYVQVQAAAVVCPPKGEVEIEMARGAILHLDVSNLAIPMPIHVLLRGPVQSYDEDWSRSFVRFAHDNDRFIDLTVIPGKYRVQLWSEGRKFSESILTIEGEITLVVPFEEPSRRRVVRVFDSDRNPIKDARVKVGAYIYRTSLYGECTLFTGDDPAVTLTVTKPGYFPAMLEASRDSVTTVFLRAASEVAIRFVSEDGNLPRYRGSVVALPATSAASREIEGSSETWHSLKLGRSRINLAFDDGSRAEFVMTLISQEPLVIPLRRYKSSGARLHVLERWRDGSERVVGTASSSDVRIPIRKGASYRTLVLSKAAPRTIGAARRAPSMTMSLISYIVPDIVFDPPAVLDPLARLPNCFPPGWWRATYRGGRFLVRLGKGELPFEFERTSGSFRVDGTLKESMLEITLLHHAHSDPRVIRITNSNLSTGGILPQAALGDVVLAVGSGKVIVLRSDGFSDSRGLWTEIGRAREHVMCFASKDPRRPATAKVNLIVPGHQDAPAVVVLRRTVHAGERLRFFTNRRTRLVLSWVMDNEQKSEEVPPASNRLRVVL